MLAYLTYSLGLEEGGQWMEGRGPQPDFLAMPLTVISKILL